MSVNRFADEFWRDAVARVTKERDIPKKATRYFGRESWRVMSSLL